jgi:hypothetical protein
MNEEFLQRETLAFAEKIALGELERARANIRVFELKYEYARWNLESFLALMKEKQDAVKS